MGTDHTPHPKNVPGAFYVEHGCCTACGIPEAIAPDHLVFDEDGQCYVKKQPSTAAETDRVIEAMWASEMQCIRYSGRDPAIFPRLGAMGRPELCDFPPAEGIPVRLRNHVTFGSIDRRPADLEDAVADFRSYWMELDRQALAALRELFHRRGGEPKPISLGWRRKVRALRRRLPWGRRCFEISWYQVRYRGVYQDGYHRIYVSNVDHDRSRIVMYHTETTMGRTLSSTLNKWLAQSKHFGDQRWYSAEEWARGIEGAPTPW